MFLKFLNLVLYLLRIKIIKINNITSVILRTEVMIKNNYSMSYTYVIIVSIRFANGATEKICRYTCDTNLNPIDKIMDKLKATLIDKDGTPTLEFANWILENCPEFLPSDILDEDSKVILEFVDSLPAINI